MADKDFNANKEKDNKNTNINYEITKGEDIKKSEPEEEYEYEEIEEEIEEEVEEETEEENEKVKKEEKKIDKIQTKNIKKSSSFSSERDNSKIISSNNNDIKSNSIEKDKRKKEEKIIEKNNDKNIKLNNKEKYIEKKDNKYEYIKYNDNNDLFLVNKVKELEQTINEKDKLLKQLSNSNLKLRNSLAAFSKKLDKELIHKKYNKNIKSNDVSGIDQVKEKELNNAVNMIKYLRNDTLRLQRIIDEKQNQLECENKKYEDIIKINNGYKKHNERLEEKIKKLYEEMANLKLKLKKAESTINLNILNNYENSLNSIGKPKIHETVKKNESQINIKGKSSRQIMKNNGKLNNLKQSSSLPKLNIKMFKLKNDNDIYNEILRSIFNDDEINKIKTIFKDEKDLFQIFVSKINIMNKSKQNLKKQYNYDKKKLNEKIIILKKEIEYLEIKIKDKEMQLKFSKSEINENKCINRQLIKQLKTFENDKNKTEIISINENNLDEIDNILNNLNKKNNYNINNFKTIKNGNNLQAEKYNNYKKDEEDNKVIGHNNKHNDNKLFIKIIKK